MRIDTPLLILRLEICIMHTRGGRRGLHRDDQTLSSSLRASVCSADNYYLTLFCLNGGPYCLKRARACILHDRGGPGKLSRLTFPKASPPAAIGREESFPRMIDADSKFCIGVSQQDPIKPEN